MMNGFIKLNVVSLIRFSEFRSVLISIEPRYVLLKYILSKVL